MTSADARLSLVDPPGTGDEVARRAVSRRMTARREPVSVVFVDVVESVSLCEGLSPEVWWELMDRMFTLLSAGVSGFDGWVEAFTGDGIVAVFTGEDHAVRACVAALALRARLAAFGADVRREHGVLFSARIGVNSGDVLIGRIGHGTAAKVVALGHATGLAKRIEAKARPGTVYLGQSTACLVCDAFRLRSLGPLDIRGAREPIELFELLDRPTRRGPLGRPRRPIRLA